MPTAPATISIAKVSGYLAANEIAKDNMLGGGSIDPKLQATLYMERKALEWINQYDSTNSTDLVWSTSYVYALCGRYKDQAAYIVNNGTGGVVIGPTSTVVSSGGGGAFYGDL
jgi:hypothetical protein